MLLYGPEPGPPPWPTELGVKGDASEPGGGPFQEAGVPGSSSVVVAANGVFRRLQPLFVPLAFIVPRSPSSFHLTDHPLRKDPIRKLDESARTCSRSFSRMIIQDGGRG